MCGGGGRSGGGGGGRIIEPDYGAATRRLDLQLEAMRFQQSNKVLMAQQSLSAALGQQQGLLGQLAEIKTLRANETDANARRMAGLLGAPPPEKSAEAPRVASNRPGAQAVGREDLRINRRRTIGPGAGLNLT